MKSHKRACHDTASQKMPSTKRGAPPQETRPPPKRKRQASQKGKRKRYAAVSSYGRFRSTYGVVSKPKPGASGYARARVDGQSYMIHRMVAVAFKLKREEGQDTVNHINRDRGHNYKDNVEWASQAQQVQHSYETNTERASNAPKRSKPVHGRKRADPNAGADAPPAEWTWYASANQAARDLDLDSGSIGHCCRGRCKHTGGYEFEYAPPNEPDLLPGEEWRDVDDEVLSRA